MKQEEIREVLERFEEGKCIYPFDKFPNSECPDDYNGSCTPCLLRCLHSQGVVIKVEGELPQVIKRTTRLMGATYPEGDPWKGDEYFEPCPICGQVGYAAVEPLIEEF